MEKGNFIIKEFLKKFPDDKTCLAELFEIRYGYKAKCPKCFRRGMFKQRNTKRQYVCPCGYSIAPTAGTIIHKSPTPLRDWFFVIYMMTSTKNKVSTKEIQRQLGVTYKCAWRIRDQIKKVINYQNKK